MFEIINNEDVRLSSLAIIFVVFYQAINVMEPITLETAVMKLIIVER